jgi:hypothetical protein
MQPTYKLMMHQGRRHHAVRGPAIIAAHHMQSKVAELGDWQLAGGWCSSVHFWLLHQNVLKLDVPASGNGEQQHGQLWSKLWSNSGQLW